MRDLLASVSAGSLLSASLFAVLVAAFPNPVYLVCFGVTLLVGLLAGVWSGRIR